MSTLAQRYWRTLTGTPRDDEQPRAERGRDGYGLWRRYWSSLLGFRLPVRHTAAPDVPANPLTEPSVRGSRIRLPRFSRVAVRLAATEEAESQVARWAAAGWQFTVRESGPGEIELLVRQDRQALADRVLPVDITTESDDHRYFMVFVPDQAGGSVGVLRLAETSGWMDVTVDEELPVSALNGTDQAVLAGVARSVAATPDPAMPAWAAIVASRPDGDPVSQVIRDAAG